MLNELDWELEKRQLRFVRYADDCIILVRSQKAAERVMKSITRYIETTLLLKVNRKKSMIGRPTDIKYLGFTFYNQFREKKYKAKAHEKSVEKVVRKLKQLTSRRWGVSNSVKAQKIAEVLRGWINYFKIGSILTVTRKLDTMLRYRFRMCIWKHWKTPRNKFRNLEDWKKKIEENNNVQVLEKETNKDKQEDIEQDQIKQEIIQFEPLKNKNTTLSILLVTIAIITIILALMSTIFAVKFL